MKGYAFSGPVLLHLPSPGLNMQDKLTIETPSLLLRRFTAVDSIKMFQMSQEKSLRAWMQSQVYKDEAHAASVLAFLMSQYETTRNPRHFPYVLGIQLSLPPNPVEKAIQGSTTLQHFAHMTNFLRGKFH